MALIVAINTPALRAVLEALQIRPSTAASWSETLQQDTLSLIALLTVAAYVDFVVRKDDAERDEEFRTDVASQLTATTDAAVRAGLAARSEQLSSEISLVSSSFASAVAAAISNDVIPTIQRTLDDPHSAVNPRECVRSALDRTWRSNAGAFDPAINGLLGHSDNCVIEKASLEFWLASLPDTDDYFKVTYRLTARLRQPQYGLVLARSAFNSESSILASTDVTDAWIFIDDEAFERTLDAAKSNTARIRYRDPKGNLVAVDVDLRLIPTLGGEEVRHYVADLSAPEGVAGDVEAEICLSVVLPTRPAGLRWIFDEPIFVESIAFDVSKLWPDRDINFTLYPFVLGTEDYTRRSEKRLANYRISINGWLTQGHGVMLVWDQ